MSTDNFSKEFDDQFDNIIELMWSSEPNSSHNMYSLLEKLTIEKYGHAKRLHKLTDKPTHQQDKESTSTDITEDFLDLFEEDLKCVICSDITISYRNQLMECDKCHLIYHQNCHTPSIDEIDINVAWTCFKCLIPTTSDTVLKDQDNKLSCDSGSDEISEITKFLEKVKSGTSTNDVVKRSNGNRTVKKVSKNAKETVHVQFKLEPDSERRKKLLPLKAKENREEQNVSKSSSRSESIAQSSSKIQFRNTGPTVNIVSAEKRLYYMKKRAAENSRLRH